jgi:hypothetical protein
MGGTAKSRSDVRKANDIANISMVRGVSSTIWSRALAQRTMLRVSTGLGRLNNIYSPDAYCTNSSSRVPPSISQELPPEVHETKIGVPELRISKPPYSILQTSVTRQPFEFDPP